jgi:hypothetical protein
MKKKLVSANYLKSLVPRAGLEPARGHTPRDFKSLASTRSATQASQLFQIVILFFGLLKKSW